MLNKDFHKNVNVLKLVFVLLNWWTYIHMMYICMFGVYDIWVWTGWCIEITCDMKMQKCIWVYMRVKHMNAWKNCKKLLFVCMYDSGDMSLWLWFVSDLCWNCTYIYIYVCFLNTVSTEYNKKRIKEFWSCRVYVCVVS